MKNERCLRLPLAHDLSRIFFTDVLFLQNIWNKSVSDGMNDAHLLCVLAIESAQLETYRM